MTLLTTTRNADLTALRDILVNQHGRKVDVVAPASTLRAAEGNLLIKGVEPVLTADGVTMADGEYVPTDVFNGGVAEKLGIPVAYLRRMYADRPDLYDANVNGWLHGRREKVRLTGGSPSQGTAEYEMLRPGVPGDARSFLVRTFRGDDGGTGVARALLSNSYAIMDNLDALTAALDGVRQAGVNVEIEGCDLTDNRMYVRVIAPEVQALAPTLLRNYRSPFSGETGADNPTVFAGFVISNSETGGGAFQIVPRLVVQVCSNGMTVTKDAMRAVHLGGRLDDGLIRWSQDTTEKQTALITAKARDSVATFLDVDYMTSVISEIEERGQKRVQKPEEAVKVISRRLAFDQKQQDDVFRMFIEGADLTAGGMLHAVTAAARVTEDADKAHDMEARALQALDLAAAL